MYARLLVMLAVFSATARADFHQLHAEKASASSFLQSSWNAYQENYHPSYVLDDDPSTAWVEGAPGDGVGESMSVRLSSLRTARTLRLIITAGYQKSKALFAANGTPTSLRVLVRNAQGQPSASATLTLKPTLGPQRFEVPLSNGLADVTLTIDGVRPGTRYKDTCISDVQFFVDSDVPWDGRVEAARHASLLAWKKERLADARYFSALPPTYPFSSTHYAPRAPRTDVLARRWKQVPDDSTKGVRAPGFVELSELLAEGKLPASFGSERERALAVEVARLAHDATLGKDRPWYALTLKSSLRLPEGLDELPPGLLALSRSADLTLFEAQARGPHFGPAPAETDSLSRSAALVLEGTPATPKRLFFKVRKVVQERSVYEAITAYVVTFEDGLLASAAFYTEDTEPGDEHQTQLLSVRAGLLVIERRDGKLAALTTRTLVSGITPQFEVSPDDGVALEVARYEPGTP